MILLGIDPGSRFTGYGLIGMEGSRIWHIDSGVIAPDNSLLLPEKLKEIYSGLDAVIGRWKPDLAGIESIFFAKNARSALVLGHARGVAMLAASVRNLEIMEFSAREIKSSVSGTGAAGKQQVQSMVSLLLNIREPMKEDRSDALAVAICLSANCRSIGKF